MQFAWLLMRCGKSRTLKKLRTLKYFQNALNLRLNQRTMQKKKSNCVKNVHQDT